MSKPFLALLNTVPHHVPVSSLWSAPLAETRTRRVYFLKTEKKQLSKIRAASHIQVEMLPRGKFQGFSADLQAVGLNFLITFFVYF